MVLRVVALMSIVSAFSFVTSVVKIGTGPMAAK